MGSITVDGVNLMTMPSDYMVPFIPSREDQSHQRMYRLPGDLVWYTDKSETKQGTGAGNNGLNPDRSTSISLDVRRNARLNCSVLSIKINHLCMYYQIAITLYVLTTNGMKYGVGKISNIVQAIRQANHTTILLATQFYMFCEYLDVFEINISGIYRSTLSAIPLAYLLSSSSVLHRRGLHK